MPSLFSPPVINMIVKSSDTTYTEVKNIKLLWNFSTFSYSLFYFYFMQILIFWNFTFWRNFSLFYFYSSFFNRFCRGQIGQQEISLYLFLYFFSDFLQRLRSFHSKQFSSFNFKMFKNVLIASGIAFSHLFLGNVLRIFPVFRFIMKCMCVLLCYFKALLQ